MLTYLNTINNFKDKFITVDLDRSNVSDSNVLIKINNKSSLFDFFEFLTDEAENSVEYLSHRFSIDSEAITDLFFEINYIFIIYFDFEKVKNSLVQRTSFELIQSLLKQKKFFTPDCILINKIIKKLYELNSWENDCSLELSIQNKNEFNLSARSIPNVREFILNLKADNKFYKTLNEKFSNSEIELSLNFLIDIIDTLFESKKITTTKTNKFYRTIDNIDFEQLQESLESFVPADYYDYANLNYTPSKLFTNISNHSEDLPNLNNEALDLNQIFLSSSYLTETIVWFCFDIENVRKIVVNLKKEKNQRLFMLILIKHEIFNLEQRQNFIRNKDFFPKGSWLVNNNY